MLLKSDILLGTRNVLNTCRVFVRMETVMSEAEEYALDPVSNPGFSRSVSSDAGKSVAHEFGTSEATRAVARSAPEPLEETFEIRGRIKWFDVSKGFGFITPDRQPSADVLLHASCLRRDGYATANEGATIVVLAQMRQRGLQAVRVVALDASAAPHPSELPPPRTHVVVAPTSGFEPAYVKWFNRERGFGFLSQDQEGQPKSELPDIFVHMEVLRRTGIVELIPGQTVLVRYGSSGKGRMASEVRLLEAASSQPNSH
jgi:cold shock protein